MFMRVTHFAALTLLAIVAACSTPADDAIVVDNSPAVEAPADGTTVPLETMPLMQTYGFCADEEEALILAEFIAAYGNEGYKTVMDAEDSRCFDTRAPYYRNTPYYQRPVTFHRGEELFKARHQDGTVYHFFRVYGGDGTEAVSWMSEDALNGIDPAALRVRFEKDYGYIEYVI